MVFLEYEILYFTDSCKIPLCKCEFLSLSALLLSHAYTLSEFKLAIIIGDKLKVLRALKKGPFCNNIVTEGSGRERVKSIAISILLYYIAI
jgi:hypothetical protein